MASILHIHNILLKFLIQTLWNKIRAYTLLIFIPFDNRMLLTIAKTLHTYNRILATNRKKKHFFFFSYTIYINVYTDTLQIGIYINIYLYIYIH